MNKKKYRAVLLIDDNEVDNVINKKIVEEAGISERVYVHTGGRSAIELLKTLGSLKTASDVLPGLILLDVDMPLMDGFQFLEEFQSLSPLVKETCRVIILSSSNNLHDFYQSKNYHQVKIFLSKPLSRESLTSIDTEE